MDESSLREALANLPLGDVRFFSTIGSTNDEALDWAVTNAPDMALVYAEEQTAGRGRGQRSWFTPAGAALAFSLVLRPSDGEQPQLLFFSALGALAVCEALDALGLAAQIKWPNDVLIGRRKVGGILAEAVWRGNCLQGIVLGIGVNVAPRAVPPPELLNFPATSVEDELQHPVHRLYLLREILSALIHWRTQMTGPLFIPAWEKRLAFRGEEVEIILENETSRFGKIHGLNEDGSLRLHTPQGGRFDVQFGEVHLRPTIV